MDRLKRLHPIEVSEFNEWLEMPVTQNLFEVLCREVEVLQRSIGEGSCLSDDPNKTLMAYYQGIGKQGGLIYPLTVVREDLIEDE